MHSIDLLHLGQETCRMVEKSPDTRWPRPAFPVPMGTRAAGSAPQTGDDSAIEIACPVCATFNPPTFRFCPQCSHMLSAPLLRERAATRPPHRWHFFRPLVCLVWFVMVLETGLLVWLGQRAGVWFWEMSQPVPSVPGREAGEGHTAIPGSRASSTESATRAAPVAALAERVGPQTSSQPESVPVALTLFDDEGDVLRQAHGTLFYNGRRVVTTFESILGAYGAAIRVAGDITLSIHAVERADPDANVAVLALDAQPAISPSTPLTLEALARTTYEETPAQQRYLAAKRARDGRWDEASTHWKRVIALDPSLPPEQAAAFVEALLQSSAVAQTEGRHADAHNRLLEAAGVLPERGDVRLRLAESLVASGEYGAAINQYGAALTLLPAQAASITSAIVRAYQAWGQGLMRQGQFMEAVRLFRTALQLDSSNGALYFALGQAEFRRRALEAAIEAFETALTYEPGLHPEIDPYLTKAQALQGGPQTVVIDFPPGATRIEVSVLIDRRLEVPCIVDTGATLTLLPTWAADLLGYRVQAPAAWVSVQTAGGARLLPYATISRLEIQGLGVSNLPVTFGDLPGHDVRKGLLGMDVLRYFSLVVDHEIGRMTLQPK